jgi:uncharacterized lipoprotein YajG
MMRRWFVGLGILALMLAGCQSEPHVSATVSNVPLSTQKVNAQLGEVLVSIAPVSEQQGYMRPEVQALVPMWRESVMDSLTRSQVFTVGATQKMDVRVKIIQLSQTRNPDLGVSTTAVASYEVIDSATGEVKWVRGISSSSTVSYQQEPVQSARDRVSLNRAIQANIAQFVQLYGHGEVEYLRVPEGQLRIQQ